MLKSSTLTPGCFTLATNLANFWTLRSKPVNSHCPNNESKNWQISLLSACSWVSKLASPPSSNSLSTSNTCATFNANLDWSCKDAIPTTIAFCRLYSFIDASLQLLFSDGLSWLSRYLISRNWPSALFQCPCKLVKPQPAICRSILHKKPRAKQSLTGLVWGNRSTTSSRPW